MRPEPAPPDQAALGLLAHADALALAATEAIAAGDDTALAALLEERGIVVAAAIAAVDAATAAGAGAALGARLTTALRATADGGQRTWVAAQRAREQVAGELAVLDARQHASQEYGKGVAPLTIDVVL